jgi:hypothetical protein
VWPDNASAVDVFVDMATQWRCGNAGFYGLDYTAIPAVMDMHGVDADARSDIFRAVRVMEMAAIEEMGRYKS